MRIALVVLIATVAVLQYLDTGGRELSLGGAPPTAPPPSGQTLKAYVLSRSDERWGRTASLLRLAALTPTRVQPLDLNASVLVLQARERRDDVAKKPTIAKYLSNKLTHVAVWRRIASDSAVDAMGYSLVFEDDVALHRAINVSDVLAIADRAAALSRRAGIFFLGACHPPCRGAAQRTGGVQFHECVGACTHAYGVFKWRAAWLYEELIALTGDMRGGPYYAIDQMIVRGLAQSPDWPSLAGADLMSPSPASHDKYPHKGIVYQDRATSPSEILSASP